MELSIKLEAVDFSDRTPTKTQLENLCGDLSNFINKLAGSVLATGEFAITDQSIATLLNAAGALKAAKEQFGANASGLAIPRAQPPMPTR